MHNLGAKVQLFFEICKLFFVISLKRQKNVANPIEMQHFFIIQKDFPKSSIYARHKDLHRTCSGLSHDLAVIYLRSVMPSCSHRRSSSSDHSLTCTSPICLLWSRIIQSLDCPIPPPMVRGSFPESTALWYSSVLQSACPASSSWRRIASALTRMPIEDSSTALPRGGYQTRISPLRLQSS